MNAAPGADPGTAPNADGTAASPLSQEACASLILKLKETEIERNKLARALRATEKRSEILRISLETQAGFTKTLSSEKTKQDTYIKLLLQSCPDIILVFDEHMKFLLGTDSIKNMIAVDDISLLQGRDMASIVERYAPPAFTPELLAIVAMVIGRGGKGDDDMPREEKLEVAAGNDKYEVRVLSFNKTTDTFSGALIVMHDVTELVAAREQAERASRSKGEFLSRMSHEMRTPMNAIIGMTSIAISTGDTAKKDYCLGKIDSASRHLLGVINDVLDMSKIEANKLDLAPQPFHFGAMLDNVTDVLHFRMEERRQTFTLTVDERIPHTLIGDELRLTQVLTNLLTNAVKFTPQGGSITLCAECVEDTPSESHLLIRVADTGIGISREQQARLFSAFEQAEGGTARKFGGTGLGLAISKCIVELMGGDIWIESELGRGATFAFTVTLPKSSGEQEEQEREAVDETAVADYTGCTILIAEDVAINREIMSAILEDLHLGIDFAVNGREAVQMFTAAPDKYQMILMDVQMPEMDGYEATRMIRAFPVPQSATIPIIAMTANVFREDVEACLAAGMNAHLGKPIEISELHKIFRHYFGK